MNNYNNTLTNSITSIKQSVLSKIIFDIKCSLDESCVRRVLNNIQNVSMRLIYFELFQKDISHLSKLVISIVFVCTKTLLRKWKGYFEEQNEKDIYEDLVKYLKSNLTYIIATVGANIKKCGELEVEEEKVSVELRCPYKNLNSIIFADTCEMSTENLIQWGIPQQENFNFEQIFNALNWPHIEVDIKYPDFEITRKFLNQSKFELVKLTSDYKASVQSNSTKLKYERVTKSAQSFPSSFILEFFKQARQKIRVSITYPFDIKMTTLNVLEEFEKDISMCTHEMETNMRYFANLTKYPYIRYLGKSENNVNKPLISWEDQMAVEKDSVNIRLKQTFTPCTMVLLSNFQVAYDLNENGEYVFCFPDDFVKTLISRNIVFKCLLCEVKTFGPYAKLNLQKHLHEEHGVEPNWICVKCNKEFTMQNLCRLRWNHNCEYVANRSKPKKKKSDK